MSNTSSKEAQHGDISRELVDRARRGDRAALEEVLAHVAPAIHRFGLRMCKNDSDADDVLQDTLLNIVNHLGEFEGRSSLSSWAFALTRSACARKRRGLKNKPPVADDKRMAEEADHAPTPEARVAEQELASALTSALDGLSEEHREVLVLRDIEGLTAQEAASSLGVSVDALKSRLHRARTALRNALRPLLEPIAPPPSGCPDIMTLWSQKLEGDLSQADCSAMEQHLATCSSCGIACDALKSALFACQRTRSAEVPPAIQERVKNAVRAAAAAATSQPPSG